MTEISSINLINPKNVAVQSNEHNELYEENKRRETDYLSKATLDAGMGSNGRPQSMYDNVGKYFDPYEFNKNFDKYIKTVDDNRLLEQQINTGELNDLENKKVKPYQLPISKILINTKRTWFDVVTGKTQNFNNDQIFYVAITFLIVALMYILLSYIFT